MILKKVIADSGGTKTDWVAVNDSGEVIRLQTRSYHPMHLSPDFISDAISFWSKYDLQTCELQFFGAGCLSPENQTKMKVALQTIGFQNPKVLSDLYAAAYAVDVSDGWVAICGTGSVAFRMEKNQIATLKGGLGWELGDEGSGFYFGKLLLERLKQNPHLYADVRKEIEKWRPLLELWAMEGYSESKYMYAHIAKILVDFQGNQLISSVHKENCDLFFQKYCDEIQTLSFVGSYAKFQERHFRDSAKKYGVSLNKIVARPLETLTNNPSFLKL